MTVADSDFHALWMQNLDYPARLDRVFADNIWTAGVLGGTSFEVSPSSPAALTVDVAAGVCVVEGGDQTAQGKYLVRKQTPAQDIAIAAAPGSGQRNDLIVVEVRDPNASGPTGDDVRIFVVAGTPDVSPVDPVAPDTCLVLARVRVPSGTGTITAGLIDDLRVQSDFQHPTGTDGLQDDAVTQAKIAPNAVGNAEFRQSAARTVVGRAGTGTGDVADIAVGTNQVVGRPGSGNVTGTQVQTDMLANGAVTSAKIGTNQVTASEIAGGAVGSAQLANGAVGATQLGSNAVTNAKIQNGAVTSAKIGTNEVTNSEIASNTILAANINSGVPLGLRQVQVFTSNGTWTRPSWMRAAVVRVQGAGGGGGGGGYSESFLTASQTGASQFVTVGTGGSGGTSSNNGSAGGFSRFGSGNIVRANGGSGGSGGSRTASGNSVLNDGGAGAVTTNAVGQVQVRGSDGAPGICGLSSSLNMGGMGGASVLGGGGRPSSNSPGGDGGDGNIAGGGGAGGHTRQSGSGVGGTGARGVVIVEMYE